MTDAKPDPLEELKRTRGADVTEYGIIQRCAAAWEKERAEWIDSAANHLVAIAALRAEVESREQVIAEVVAEMDRWANGVVIIDKDDRVIQGRPQARSWAARLRGGKG